jgi:hypothetical protein
VPVEVVVVAEAVAVEVMVVPAVVAMAVVAVVAVAVEAGIGGWDTKSHCTRQPSSTGGTVWTRWCGRVRGAVYECKKTTHNKSASASIDATATLNK